MIDQPADELVTRLKTAKRLFQDYRYKVTSGDPEQISYHTEQANFWLGKYRALKEELNQRNNPEKPTDI
jgi:hypothetical protein